MDSTSIGFSLDILNKENYEDPIYKYCIFKFIIFHIVYYISNKNSVNKSRIF